MDQRSYYEGLTIAALKDICRKDKIANYSGLKKKELVDLIVGKKHGVYEQSPRSKTLSNLKSGTSAPKGKAKSPAPKGKSVPKKKSSVGASEDTEDTAEKIMKEIDKSAGPKITKRVSGVDKTKAIKRAIGISSALDLELEKMERGASKPTGVLYMPLLRTAMANIEMYNEAGSQEKAIENAELIKEYKNKYFFGPSFESSLNASIESVITTFGDAKIKRAIKPKKSPYKKGDYKPVDILSVKFGKKGDAPPTGVVAPKKINITLDELRKEIDNPVFIKEYTQSVRELMKAKIGLYQKRKAEVKQEYESINRKVQKLKATGTDNHSIKEMYPGFEGLKVFIIDLEDLIELVRKRSTEVTEEGIKEGLLEAIDDQDNGLNSIVGRDDVKNQLASQIYSFSKGYKTFIGSFNNIAIYGSAGTGKTRLAAVIAFALSKIGILARDTVKIVTRADLVGQYVGHTAPRTRSALIETLEGILFIDEAYQLTDCPESGRKDPFGAEAITEIVNFLDKYIGLNIVIVAGYEGLMTRCFMTFNEGLPRRFPYRYILSPYSDAELTDILLSNLRKKLPEKLKIDAETSNFIFSLVSKIRVEIPDAFKNQAGDMLNLSASLNKTISSSFKVQWKTGDLASNVPIILAGFDDFLETKGFSLYA